MHFTRDQEIERVVNLCSKVTRIEVRSDGTSFPPSDETVRKCALLFQGLLSLRSFSGPLPLNMGLQLAQHCPGLQVIKLSSANLTGYVDLVGVVALLENYPQLHSIDITQPGGNEGSKKAALTALSQLRNLQEVRLRAWGPISDEILAALASQIQIAHFKDCAGTAEEGLLSFIQNHSDLNDFAADRVTDSMLRALGPKLVKLELRNSDDFTDEALLDFAQAHPQLKSLSIHCSREVPDAVLEQVGDKCQQLEHLSIAYSGYTTDERIQSLVDNHFPSLQTVCFEEVFNFCNHYHIIRGRIPGTNKCSFGSATRVIINDL